MQNKYVDVDVNLFSLLVFNDHMERYIKRESDR